MTPEDEPKAPPATAQTAEESSADDVADDAMRALLKRSLDAKTAPAPAPEQFLRGVQKRIRTRSRGKFYADGWSTSSPRLSYTLIALVMLLIVALAYFVLGPTGVSAP
ncbi:MAG: hypothetical protein ACLQVI_05640 [Polyangiaceae bacterium]